MVISYVYEAKGGANIALDISTIYMEPSVLIESAQHP